ncbi:MAG: metal ABC transporter permease [Planctomycetes bacterium]|nr:metal ABC transporter permease [Planctomycetota bacterium]
MPDSIEILLMLTLTAMACSLLGVFLVLKRMALLSDAIGHVLLLGIVIAFLLTADLQSIALIIGAALSGLALVAIVEMLARSRLVKEDAAIGLVFPALFALGILLASLYCKNTHLDIDRVFFGIPELAPLQRLIIGPYDVGMTSRWIMTGMVIVNAAFIAIFFKELKIATFDAALAATLGFFPILMHYALLGLVSLTAVTAFEAVGPVLVVAFMVVPGATAYLLTDRLSRMLLLSAVIASLGAVIGTLIAQRLDINIAGAVATVLGVQFAVTFIAAPERGLIVQATRRMKQRREFFETMLLIHLLQHEGTPEQADESRLDGLHEHLRWRPRDLGKVVRRALGREKVVVRDELLWLSDAGREQARGALNQVS